MFGSDPNWGRVAAAAGYADAEIDPEHLDVTINGVLLCKGAAVAGDRADCDLSGKDILIEVGLGLSGGAEGTPPRSGPPTCHTPTWRRTVPTPPEPVAPDALPQPQIAPSPETPARLKRAGRRRACSSRRCPGCSGSTAGSSSSSTAGTP